MPVNYKYISPQTKGQSVCWPRWPPVLPFNELLGAQCPNNVINTRKKTDVPHQCLKKKMRWTDRHQTADLHFPLPVCWHYEVWLLLYVNQLVDKFNKPELVHRKPRQSQLSLSLSLQQQPTTSASSFYSVEMKASAPAHTLQFIWHIHRHMHASKHIVQYIQL